MKSLVKDTEGLVVTMEVCMAKNNIPRHIGFIPDGNRRWATNHGLPKEAGYAHGINPMSCFEWSVGLIREERCIRRTSGDNICQIKDSLDHPQKNTVPA